jgi:hypothetical protein
MPDDRREVVKADPTAVLLDRGVKRNDRVATLVLSAGKADVAHNADETASRNKDIEAMLPNPVQLREERLVVGDIAELAFGVTILLEGPVRRGSDHEVN